MDPKELETIVEALEQESIIKEVCIQLQAHRLKRVHRST